MKHEETPLHPSNYTPERVISDAILVQDGAEIEDGHLHATAEQIIEIAQQHEQEEDQNIGAVAVPGAMELYSRSAEVAMKDVDEIVSENDRMLDLTTAIADAARPYTSILSPLVPEPSSRDRNFRGKLKDKVDLELDPIERRLDGFHVVSYNLGVSYVPGEKTNQLSSFGMEIKIPEERGSDKLTLGYRNGMLKSIDLAVGRSSLIGHLSSADPADRRELDKFFLKDNIGGTGRLVDGGPPKGSLHIEIGDTAVTIDTTSKAKKQGYHYYFDPEMDAFVRNEYEYKRLNSQQVVGIVRGILGLIPTMPAER